MKSFFLALSCAIAVEAHVGVFTDGMFCRGGNDGTDNQNTNLVVNPLYNLTKDEWWMQRDRGCDKVPPPEGEFLDLPAGGSFTVELATNRAFTTLSYGGENTSDWPDGGDHPEDWSAPPGGECIEGAGGALHTKNEATTAGTAWAISYEKDLSAVTMENLVVFSVLEHTPWKRLATYEVPADLPACPEEGCYCAWLWIPDGCGEPNIFRCRVTNTSSTKKLGVAQVPVPCRDDPSACVTGPKQMISWNQAEGNNVGNIGFSPAYNMRLGYQPGAQNDIFVEGDNEEVEVVESSTSSPVASPTASQAPESSPAEVTPSPIFSPVPSASASSTESAAPEPTETTLPGDGHSECSAKKARRRRRARAVRAARAAARL